MKRLPKDDMVEIGRIAVETLNDVMESSSGSSDPVEFRAQALANIVGVFMQAATSTMPGKSAVRQNTKVKAAVVTAATTFGPPVN